MLADTGDKKCIGVSVSRPHVKLICVLAFSNHDTSLATPGKWSESELNRIERILYTSIHSKWGSRFSPKWHGKKDIQKKDTI